MGRLQAPIRSQEKGMGYADSVEEFSSTITAKGQTTVPKPVRQALGLNEGDQIAFRLDENGVTVRRADEERVCELCDELAELKLRSGDAFAPVQHRKK